MLKNIPKVDKVMDWPEIIGFAAGGGGVAVVVDFDLPALGLCVGRELFSLDSEPVGGLVPVFA